MVDTDKPNSFGHALIMLMGRRLVLAVAAVAAVAAFAGFRLAQPERSASAPAKEIAPAKEVAPAKAVAPVKRSAPAHRTSFSLAAVGDIAMVEADEVSFFGGVTRYLRGDVVFGNLEGTLTTRGYSKCGSGSSNCFAFRAPPSYARVLRRAGFTVMNTANNHAYDYGSVGLADTIAALDQEGLKHTGRPGEIALLRAHGATVAFVGFASYPWSQSLTDIPAARALVRRADRVADVVVATMHAGAEGSDQNHVRPGPEYFLGEHRGDVYRFSHAVVDAGADLVIGHGPHVLRGMEFYRGRLIAYSLGNFLGYKTFNNSGVLAVSGILKVTLRSDGSYVRGSLVPVTLADRGLPQYDRAEAAHGVVRQLSKSDFGSRGARISFKGAILRP